MPPLRVGERGAVVDTHVPLTWIASQRRLIHQTLGLPAAHCQ
jgi:hypothetical protein